MTTMAMLKLLARRSANAAVTTSRCTASARFTTAATSHLVDNNAFLTGVSEEQAKKALERGQEIRTQHHAATESFPNVR